MGNEWLGEQVIDSAKVLYLKCLIRFKDILGVYKYFKCFDSINFIANLKY